MSRAGLAVRYVAFAVIATLANLGAQRLALWGGEEPWRFAMALGLGTLAGLAIKYALDKRWIFGDREGGLRAHGRKFGLYSAMGVVTTAIFWGAETAAWALWRTDVAREAGAVLGLVVGYAVKYRLDRRFVFARAAPG